MWKNGEIRTLRDVEKHIKGDIEYIVKKDGGAIFSGDVEAWLESLAREIGKTTDGICAEFGVPWATLALTAKSTGLVRVSPSLRLEGELGDVTASIVGTISGMLIGVIAGLFIATPDLLTQILAFIISGVVAIISALGIKMGIRGWTEDIIRDLDLWTWVRWTISRENKVRSIVSDSRDVICEKITASVVAVVGTDESLERILAPIREELHMAADKAAMLIRRSPGH